MCPCVTLQVALRNEKQSSIHLHHVKLAKVTIVDTSKALNPNYLHDFKIKTEIRDRKEKQPFV